MTTRAKNQVLDRVLNKLVSRKLMVWLTATALMFTETTPLQSEDWVAISLAYIGIQGLADIASSWRHGS
tara:strand:+ start:107 stop:313 length:207 start_codon:yes stop_codon:yes gene_type:complete